MSILKVILKCIDTLSEKSGKVAGASLILLIGVVAAEVISRKLFGSPIAGSFDISYMLWGFLFIIASAWTMLTGGHIRIDTVVNHFPPRANTFLELFLYLFICFPVLIVLLVKGIELSMSSLSLREAVSSPPYLPIYPLKFTIPVGAFLLLLQCIAKFACDIMFIIRGKP